MKRQLDRLIARYANLHSFKKMLRSPLGAFKVVLREIGNEDVQELSKLFSVKLEVFEHFYKDLYSCKWFHEHIQDGQGFLEKSDVTRPGLSGKREATLCYAVVRYLRPKIVVETGVGNGISSSFILLALADNGDGSLYSIDLPNTDALTSEHQRFLPQDKDPGWLVPNKLRSNWHLLLGDAKHLLPELLSKIGGIDIFLHDSLHTYEHMLWEYNTAWPHLSPSGLLMSHDIDFNAAFNDFCSENTGIITKGFGPLGIIRKI